MGLFSRDKPRKESMQPPVFRLMDLPVDILLQLVEACDVTSLHMLRRTSRGLHTLITTNMHSIAPAVARNTFPTAPLSLFGFEGATLDLAWLDDVRLRWMAAVFVKHPAPDRRLIWAITADDPAGDIPRASVTEGLKVLRQLHLISRRIDEYDDLPDDEPILLEMAAGVSRRFHFTKAFIKGDQSKQAARSPTLDRLSKREEKIVHHRLQYLAALPKDSIADFNNLIALIACCGGFAVVSLPEDLRYHIDVIDGGITPETRRFTKGRSWLFWWVMHQGPALFLTQWLAAKDSTEASWIQHQCHAAVGERSIQQINVERDAGQRVSKAIALRLPGGLDLDTALTSDRGIFTASQAADKGGACSFAHVPFSACFGEFCIREDKVEWHQNEPKKQYSKR